MNVKSFKVIFILLLFICFSIKNTMDRPLTLITTVILSLLLQYIM